jgi:hypothetical protein
MTLHEIASMLGAVLLSGTSDLDIIVEQAYCADLMSDVLYCSVSNSLLITHLTNAQVIRTAHIADLKAVVFCEDKRPDAVTINLAEKKGIPLLVTGLSMFDACGLLYERGLRGCLILKTNDLEY